MHGLLGKSAGYLAAVAVALLAAASAHAAGGRLLWTTQEDFTGWYAGGDISDAPVATPDSDGISTNGIGNPTAPGAAGTAGSQSITWTSGTFDFTYSTDLGANTSLLTYMGTQGIIKYDFTYPQIHVGSYFGLGITLNYNDHFQIFFGTNTATANANGFNTTTIEYTGFNAASITSNASPYLQYGVTYNSDYSPLDPFYVDNFHVIGHGDFNEDGHVDAADIKAMEDAIANPEAYTAANGLSAADLAILGDFNGDSALTNADLQGFLNYLKAGNGSLSSVPEPTSLLLLGLGAPLLIGFSRRARKSG